MTPAASARKFLFIHPFGIGDVIFSLTAADALARRGHTVDYLCNERTGDLLRLCPVVRKAHAFDRSALRADLEAGRFVGVCRRYAALRREIAAERYDAAIDFSMGREYALLAWSAGIRSRVGWDYKGRGRWLTRKIPVTGFDDRSPRGAAMDLARLIDPGIPGSGSRDAAVEYPRLSLPADPATDAWLARVTGSSPWFVIAPGGGESWGKDAHYKRWPEEHWAALVRTLRRDTRASVAVVGSEAEKELVASVTAKAGSGSVGGVAAVIGESFGRVAALIQGARVFVGTDGGLLHLANLAGVPTVGIYGPVSDIGYGPLNTSAPTRILTAEVPCRPCYRNFRFTGCAYEKRCLTSIPPDRVAEEIRLLLVSES